MTRLEKLEWLAEFVMYTEDSIPIGCQQRLIRCIEAVNMPENTVQRARKREEKRLAGVKLAHWPAWANGR